MKKIAIPTNGTVVDEHYGHCEFYTIYSIESDNSIARKQMMPSPAGCGCKSNIASILADMGVSILLAGNMGEGAVNNLAEAGLDVYRGFVGNTEDALKAFLNGDTGSDIMCNHSHGDSGHSCSHNA
ncbi:MAG: NifB/NifX family molybdenum-iron cluster-binding protein [Bacteroidales bacterium]|nr:NifB/NifX family molybdenum-iron cluster-binding protein [Bacteroidales bacterium]